MKQKEQTNTGGFRRQEDWTGAQCEEIETCLNKKQQQESISAGEGSNLRETG